MLWAFITQLIYSNVVIIIAKRNVILINVYMIVINVYNTLTRLFSRQINIVEVKNWRISSRVREDLRISSVLTFAK